MLSQLEMLLKKIERALEKAVEVEVELKDSS